MNTYPLHRFLWENGFCKTSREAKLLISKERIFHIRSGWKGDGKPITMFFDVEDVRKGDMIIMKDKSGNILHKCEYTFETHLKE